MSQKQAWSLDSWQWDPYKLVAAPAGEKSGLQQKKVEPGGELSSSSSPTCSGEHPAKAIGRSRGPPTCQVEGCVTDLSGLKEYHNRYKICEYHLKIPSIMREGGRQRFCQQCGRFHNLGEFDGDKRSCRARLQRHNARRRKKGESELVKATKKPLTNRQHKEQAQAAPSRSASPMSDDAKASSESPMADGQFQQDGHLHQASHPNPWQHELDRPADVQDWAACAPSTGSVLETAFTDFLKQENAQAMQPNMHMPAFFADGDLGSTLTQQMLMGDLLADCSTSDPVPSSDEMGMQYGPDMLCPPTNPAFKPGHQPDYLHQPGMQHSDHGTSPMYLMHQQVLQAARDRGYHTGLQQQQQQPQQPLSSWCRPPDMVPHTMDIGMDDFPSMHYPTPPDVGHSQRRLLSCSQLQQPPPHGQMHSTPKLEPADDMQSVQTAAPSSQPASQPAVLDQARDLLNFNHCQPKYIPEEQFTRMSAKLFNCTPKHLPYDLKQNLVGLLSCGVNSIEGYIMPGCLQLTVEALVGSEQLAAMQDMSARQAVEQLLQGQNKAFWASDAMLVQWQDDLVLVKDGAVQTVVSGASSTGLLPEIHSMSPVCVSNDYMGTVSISGANIAGEGQTVLCRSQGSYVPVEVSPVAGTSSNILNQQLHMRLPAGLSRGSVQVEVVRGGFISHSKPVLILDNEEAVAEVLQLSSMPIPGMNVSSMLRDLGHVLEFSNSKRAAVTNGQQHARQFGTEEESIAATARRLLSFSCQVGWVAVSELLLPIASAMAGTASELVANLERISDEGLTLLHHVVRSRNASLVSLVLTWGTNNGHVWDCTAAGPAGLTPLHLAALLDDGGRIADELTDACAGALSWWDSLKAADGSTAADLAARSGGQNINAMIQRKLEGYSSGLHDQPYQFDPDTGEWLGDDVAEPAGREITPFVIKPADTPVLPSALSNVSSTLLPVQTLPANDQPQQSLTETADSLQALSSPSSSGFDDGHKSTGFYADAVFNGLHQRSSAKGKGTDSSVCADEDQLYLKDKVHGGKAVPKVFDSRAALLSSAVVGAMGVIALGLRYSLEYYGL
ncbi:TPA: hypothetical protein ACH3X1_015182 [Trebouxia sp. C0004]